MHIDRLHLRDLMGHVDLEIELAPGLTVVRGPNEAGKSTIQRAIEFAFFRRATAQGQDVERLRRWGAPEEAAPTLEMDFSADDGTTGHLLKVFAGAKGRTELRLGEEVVDDPAEVDRRLVGLTGIPSVKFFRSTAAVHHLELAELDRDEATLRDRLQVSVSGGDRGTGGARKKLDDAIRKYAAEGPKNPGIVKAIRDRVVVLEMQAAAGEAALARLEAERAGLSRARDDHAAAEENLATERARLADAERAVALLARMTEDIARYGHYRREAELVDEIAAAEAAHPSKIPLATLRPALERLRAAEGAISTQRAQIAGSQIAIETPYLTAAPAWRLRALAGLALLVAGAGAAAWFASGAGGPVNLPAAAGGLVAAGLGALLVAVAVLGFRQGSAGREQVRLYDEYLATRSANRAEIERTLGDLEAARATELEGLGLPETAAAEAQLAAEADHEATIDRLRAELRGLLADEPPGDAAAQRDAAAAAAEQARFALAGMGEIGVEPAQVRARAVRGVEAAVAERERTMRLEAEAQGRLDANEVDAEAVAALAEQLAEARERLALAERRQRILRTTLAGIDAAEAATMQRVARFLERHMAGDVDHLTGGRYRRVKVDEAELTFSVWSPERGDWVEVERLSQGTIDQFYLAARLGLVRQVTQGRRPPLIFDDPFLTFDDERAQRALGLLRETAADLQVIYLTTSDRYDAIADRVVVLPAPTGKDVDEPTGQDAEAPSPSAAGIS
ncbi:MAG: ATP-binding protein [Candidatus Limnocylindrales bacterium]